VMTFGRYTAVATATEAIDSCTHGRDTTA
jgi:hypothetical protein